MKRFIILALLSSVMSAYGQKFITTDKFVQSAVKEILSKAKKGDAQAQYTIGMHYFNGSLLARDLKLAEDWLGKACDNHYIEALEPAADACAEILKSQDTEIDIFEAIAYYNRAQKRYEEAVTKTIDDKVRERIADKMTLLCMGMRQVMHQDFKDLKETDGDFLILKNAADYGSLEAAGFMALYYEGEGKIDQSIPYFIKAAEKGDFISQARVGQYLYKNKDYTRGFRYLKMACTNPDEEDVWDFVHENSIEKSESGEIMHQLARCYRFGLGTGEKPKIAELWDILSAFYASADGQDIAEINGMTLENPEDLMNITLDKFRIYLKKDMVSNNSAKILYYISHINNQTAEIQSSFQALINLSNDDTLNDIEKAFVYNYLSVAYQAALSSTQSEYIIQQATKYKRLSEEYDEDPDDISKWIASTLRLSLSNE